MMERVLITGGAGFIGTRLVRNLIRRNPERRIWVFDNLHPQVHGPSATTPDLPPGVSFVRGDIADASAVQTVVATAQAQLVYHLAAETGTGQSYDQITRYCDVNVTGTGRLIEAIRSSSNDVTQRLVLAGSRAVYGEGAYRDADGVEHVGLPRQPLTMRQGCFDVPLPASARLPARPIPSHAGSPPAPASIYATTKLMQEYLLRQGGEGTQWGATILRFQNVYGPGQSLRNPYTGVLSIFAQQLLAGKSLAIYEDGKIARDFVFVDDVVNALGQAGERNLPHGTTIDIGSGMAVTIHHVAQMLIRALGRRDRSLSITGEFRVGDIRHACADIQCARELLDWTPEVKLETGIHQLAEWARSAFKLQEDSDG